MTRSTYLMLHIMLENTCIFSIYHVWYVPNVLAVFCYLASTAKKLQSFEMNGVKLSAYSPFGPTAAHQNSIYI